MSPPAAWPSHCPAGPPFLDLTPVFPCSYGNDQSYFEEIKAFYYRDEFSHQVQEWNRQRTLAIERALRQFLYPQMAKELMNKLLLEAKECVVKVGGWEAGGRGLARPGWGKAILSHSRQRARRHISFNTSCP